MLVIFRKLIYLLKSGQKKLWEISLLYVLISTLTVLLTFFVPLLTIVLVSLLSFGLSFVMLKGYRKQEIRQEDLFAALRRLKHFSCGILWAKFKTLVWLLIPFGFIGAIYRYYEYRFVPYILLTDKSIKASDAVKISSKATAGFKGCMFFTDALIFVPFAVVEALLYFLSGIELLKTISLIAACVLGVLFLLVLTLVRGLIGAGFYCETQSGRIKPRKKKRRCPCCKTKLSSQAQYCFRCGKKIV